ncbi:MAG: phosphotransferase family protein [Pseudomonadota bacterium]
MTSTQDFNTQLKQVFGRIFGNAMAEPKFKRLSGGASQETWAISDGENQAILRRAPGGHAREQSSAAINLNQEAELIAAAGLEGVPVPKILHVLSAEDGLGEGFLMSKIEGETIARPILRDDRFEDARKKLPAQCGSALAQIHAVPIANLNELPHSDGLQQLERYEEIYRGFDVPRPIFELAMAWLKKHAPTPLEPVLVHGDFRLGNLMIDQEGLAAVLDWELAHIGDPREDISWICVNSWRFGQTDNRVGGFGHLEPLLAAYAAARGVELTPTDIDWWEMLGSLKWGVMCMLMYEAFRSGSDPSVERAAIGRRVSETEIDLVNLLEQAHA